MTIQPHHLHTHGPEPLYTPVKADDVRPKIDVRKFDLDDETTWPDPERDGEYVRLFDGEKKRYRKVGYKVTNKLGCDGWSLGRAEEHYDFTF